MEMTEETKILYKSIEGRYVKVVWTHKIQEKQADIYCKKSKLMKKHICWFTVLTTGGVLFTLLPFPPLVIGGVEINIPNYISTVLALFLSYFNLRYGDGMLDDKASENRRYAAQVHNLRNKYEALMYDILAGKLSDDEIISSRNSLESIENDLYSVGAPFTSEKAVDMAKVSLKQRKDSTTEIEELKAIMPPDLLVL